MEQRSSPRMPRAWWKGRLFAFSIELIPALAANFQPARPFYGWASVCSLLRFPLGILAAAPESVLRVGQWWFLARSHRARDSRYRPALDHRPVRQARTTDSDADRRRMRSSRRRPACLLRILVRLRHGRVARKRLAPRDPFIHRPGKGAAGHRVRHVAPSPAAWRAICRRCAEFARGGSRSRDCM